ncbi:MAG: membrane-bound O-acyltransferase family protein, partial [Pseudomonadota bacterium]|nr:membrane-bound O-acyltransferase family protein [Pseudomonadota bacterium]
VLVLAYAVVLLMGLRDRLGWSPDTALAGRLQAALPALLVPVFVLTVLKLSAESFSPFLYFQF